MLLKLLELLKDDTPHSLHDLAGVLDTSVEMVEAMLETLAQMGYVRQITGCGQHCAACASRAGCVPVHTGRIWALAE